MLSGLPSPNDYEGRRVKRCVEVFPTTPHSAQDFSVVAKLYYYDDDFDFDTESLSSFESDEDFVHSISSSEDDTSDEENFSSVRQWCKIDSSSPAPSRFRFTGEVVTI
ncbi:piggyBac transposable element-derived protein 4 [Trichonephila clavipes]|nr:piggyBac transposable element-derived protein 4 [Trichonephila clavipes]